MRDYADAYRNFFPEALEREVLKGRLDRGVNAAVECCDRWVGSGRIALEWMGSGARESLTFVDLREQSARFANLLAARGIGRGDVVAGLLPRVPELLVVVIGTWRVGAVYQPLFTAFGPRAIEQRVTAVGGSRAQLIVTDAANSPKLAEVGDCPPALLIDRGRANACDFAEALADQPSKFDQPKLRGEDPFIVIFTSGTTGAPKGGPLPVKLAATDRCLHA
jgi:acetyl-CoA synthetase